MTQEEKYKKALLEARAVLEPCLKYSNGKVREALDSIDKELKSFESEDERIRKALIEAFEVYDIESSWNLIPVKHILAWLEKQKEPENTSASTMAPSCWQKEQKDYNKLYEDIGKSEWFKKAYEGKSLGCDYEQKEQKPDWSEEDEQLLGFIYDLLADSLWNSRYAMSRDECLDRLTSLRQRLQPRPSWKPSEEQMAALEAATVRYQSTGLESLYEDIKKLM